MASVFAAAANVAKQVLQIALGKLVREIYEGHVDEYGCVVIGGCR